MTYKTIVSCRSLQGARELPKHKATDPMKWVGLMNTCKAQAEEIIKFELIYV